MSNQKQSRSRKLEHKVDGCEEVMMRGCEYEVDQQDGEKRADDGVHQDLYGKGVLQRWSKGQNTFT